VEATANVFSILTTLLLMEMENVFVTPEESMMLMEPQMEFVNVTTLSTSRSILQTQMTVLVFNQPILLTTTGHQTLQTTIVYARLPLLVTTIELPQELDPLLFVSVLLMLFFQDLLVHAVTKLPLLTVLMSGLLNLLKMVLASAHLLLTESLMEQVNAFVTMLLATTWMKAQRLVLSMLVLMKEKMELKNAGSMPLETLTLDASWTQLFLDVNVTELSDMKEMVLTTLVNVFKLVPTGGSLEQQLLPL
jgi:hypothetical protein